MQPQRESSLDDGLFQALGPCHECKEACITAVGHCLDQGGTYAEPAHIRVLRGCADICQTTINFMLRGAELLPIVAAACAEICLHAAESCDVFPDDPVLRRSARACRNCVAALTQR
jgi:hypothetical protein